MKNTRVKTLDELIERLGGGRQYDKLYNEVMRDCGYRNGIITYPWSSADTFQLSLIQDFIRDACLRPANEAILKERLERLVFEELGNENEMFRSDEEHIIKAFQSKLKKLGIEMSDDFSWDTFIDDARDVGLFQLNFDGLLRDTRVPCVFVLATPDERLEPDTLNDMRLALYGDDKFALRHDPDDYEKEQRFWSNSIVWLTRQQGYYVEDLFPIDDPLPKHISNSRFLRSVWDEFNLSKPSASPCLAVLAELAPKQLIKVLAQDECTRNIVFPEDVSVGLYDHKARSVYDFVSEQNGFFAIELEKPLVISKELLSYVFVETPDYENYEQARAEASKQGFTDDAWKPGVCITEFPTLSVLEMKESLPIESIQRAVNLRIKQVSEQQELGDEPSPML